MSAKKITQNISAVPDAGKRGIDANDVFVQKQEEYQDHQRINLQPELENFRNQANELSTDVNDKSATTIEKANLAKESEDIATQAKNETVQAKEDTLRAIDEAEIYNPSRLERRMKDTILGIKII